MNNSYVKPDKSKHVYVLGIDFGHGETSADICSIQWDTNFSQLTVPESIEIFNGVPAIKSILLIEKISGALHFIENLKSLKVLCSEVDSVIDKIIELNKSVAPEIHPILGSIDVSIQPIQEEIDNLNKELDKKITEKEGLENRLEYILSYWNQRSDEAKKKREEKFKRQYPRYEIVDKEISDLNDKIFPLKKYVKSRKKLRKRLTDCNDIMNSYIQ